jgi:hypothetical protein
MQSASLGGLFLADLLLLADATDLKTSSRKIVRLFVSFGS